VPSVSPSRRFAHSHQRDSSRAKIAGISRRSERHHHILWLSCFPEAQAIERRRIPSRKVLIDAISTLEFRLVSQETIDQYFARSYEEYFEKIRQRGLSSLIAISDEAFEAGLARLKNWIATQPRDLPVYEPVDHFTFGK
jgi:hypothetical protein